MRVERTDSTTASWEAQRHYAQEHNRNLTQLRAARADAEQIVDNTNVQPDATTAPAVVTEPRPRSRQDGVAPPADSLEVPTAEKEQEPAVPPAEVSTAEEIRQTLRPPLFPPPWVRMMRDDAAHPSTPPT